MNKIIGIVSKGISSLAKNIKAIVNTVSQPKDKPNGGIYTGSSSVTVGGAGTDHVIPKSSKFFSDFEKEAAQKREIPDELYKFHVMGTWISSEESDQNESMEGLTNEIETLLKTKQDCNSNFSINRQLSYKKKKTQQRNWSKWKRRVR